MTEKKRDIDPAPIAFETSDERAFERVHRRYYRPILSWLRARMDDPAAAEDLAQEVFLKTLRGRSGFTVGGSFSSWIWTIARNTWKDWMRSRSAPIENFEEGAHELVPCGRPDPERILEQKNMTRELRLNYAGLTKLQKQVFRLNVLRGLPYSEIADRMGLSVASVKSLAYRTRLALAES